MNNPQLTHKNFLRHVKQLARTFLARGGIHEIKLEEFGIEERNQFSAIFISAFYRALVEMGALDHASSLEMTRMGLDVYSSNPNLIKVINPAFIKFTGDNYYILEALRSKLSEKEADCFMRIFYITGVAHQNALVTAEMRDKIERFVLTLFKIKFK